MMMPIQRLPVMLMKNTLLVFYIITLALNSSSQTVDKIAGSYRNIDSTSSSYEKDGKWYKDIDTTLLLLKNDMTFNYKWSPMFGAYSKSHLLTTGTWKMQGSKVILDSKYQQDEHRFFEHYKPEYGDSMVKVYVQTYDSLISYFQFQFIGVIKDTTRDSQMIFKDKDYPYNACVATFHLSQVDKIIFYGDFGRMPMITPKNKKSNHFLLQYNLSDNWDYQYFKDFEININGNKAILGGNKDDKITLTKM